MVTFNRADLEFILQQITISERQASGESLLDILPNVEVPWGLRTVDGTLNNLVPGQTDFGSADATFPRLSDPVFQPAEAGTSYAQTTGTVIDSTPRTISNLIVDQTANNPAAVAAANQTPGSELVTSPGMDGIFGTADDRQVFSIPNLSPDVGLSAPFNPWFTFFGQFFDHGLDLVTKGGNGTIFVPLKADDPLVAGVDGVFGTPDDLPPQLRFMVETRATMLPGADGILGTADDIHEQQNTTTPFIDQNQTYSSHPSHQVFLRAYAIGPDGQPHATGKLIENRNLGADHHFGTADDTPIGGMATWAVVKAQANDILGIHLTDRDFDNVPLLATDEYGNFIKGAHGMPQVVMKGADGIGGTADDVLVEGNRLAPIDLANAVRTDHQFLIDVAHNAVPVFDAAGNLAPDADNVAGNAVAFNPLTGQNLEYDNELLDSHYIAGDGRVNENIGLTAVHSIFHSEHNRLVDHTKDVVLATQDVSFINQWLLAPVTAIPADPSTLQWDGERLFQAARFGTEMQYQHLVFEEFARTLVPGVDEFLAPNGYDTTIDPSVFAEFAHAVFRLGHSMLTETVDRLDPNFDPVNQDPNNPFDDQLGLIHAFLNPLEFAASGPTPAEATGAIVRGLTRQVGNAIDEFVTDALRDNLLGTPLDLAVLNIARGRDTGLPSLNAARAQFQHIVSPDTDAGDSWLQPYGSWADFTQHLKHPESVINFIAAYGTHPLVAAETTLEGKRAAAALIVLGGTGAPTDRFDFLYSTGDWANNAGTHAADLDGVTTTGLGSVDLWVGGLAEQTMPFGSMLGSTFQFVFETQLENLQNGDRFYYLARTAGLHFGAELENNSFAKLVMANTDVTHLPADIFSTPAWILEADPTKQFTGLGADGRADPTFADDQPAGGQSAVLASENNPTIINGVEIVPLVIRDNPDTVGPDTNYLHYTGNSPVVLGGTSGNDILIAGASDQDTVYGDAGNDRLDGGAGDDNLFGGAGDDIITSGGGTDKIDGGDGNDVITESHSNLPLDLPNIILGGAGKDFVAMSDDISMIFGGAGDDFIVAGMAPQFGQGARNNLPETGNEGDDWIEEGTQDGAPGDNMAPFLADDVAGNDIFVGGGGFDEMIGEGGDDIFVGSDAQDKMDGMSGFDWTTYKDDKFGITVDMRLPIFAPAHGATAVDLALGGVQAVGQSPDSILDRFAEVEGLSGSRFSDIMYGDDQTAAVIAGITAQGSVLTNPSLIQGLQAFLGAGVTSFGAGNIILGGDGSDLIWGNGGDDLIDGDRWLNVRISVRANADGTGPEIASFDHARDLTPFMVNGTYNPGQLVAVREILPGHGGYDTANFRGGIGDYSIVIDDNGTPDDLSDDIITVTDIRANPVDGSDRLTHIERLQFADMALILDPSLNAQPDGVLQVLDAVSGTPDSTPTEGQALRVSIAGVTDADNAGGVIHGASFVWQREVQPGVFEDIVLKPGRIGVGFPNADGATFVVDPLLGLAGSALRVRAVYEDEHGVTEQVFSDPTAPVIASPVAPVVAAPFVDHTQLASGGAGVHFIRSDLTFILDQIHIAERHAGGEELTSILPNVRVPFGLRTVDGSENNLVNFGASDQTGFGSADQTFPRLTTPVFRPAEAGTSYQQTSGTVIDSAPRTISNLIVDQTADNPAAYATAYNPGADGILNYGALGNDDVLKDGVTIVASPGLDGLFGTADDRQVFQFDNIFPDAGMTEPFDAWFTFFGQFFDHGLDLVTKGGNGSVFVPLKDDDPLVAGADGLFGTPDDLPPQLRFMVETRATMLPGADGVLGTADDIHENQNTTTPFVDQNQTYTSHPSHQVFLRAYAIGTDGQTHATGKLIENRSLGADHHFGTADDTPIGGMATWAVVKAQAHDLLGINLTDKDFDNVPLLATDPYGNYIRGAHGLPQVVMKGADGIGGTADDVLVEGNRLAPIDLTNAVRTGHQFLIDVAHNAVPVLDSAGSLVPDADSITGNAQPFNPLNGQNLSYDDELLDAHYIAGDGRVNENIGLTAVHSIFHSEHNRLVDQVKQTILVANADTPGFINDWVMPGFVFTPGMTADQVDWNGERLFQVAKFGTEMQYQHLVFEEFARTVQPLVDPFFAPTQVYDTNINPAIVAEFAHTVYRFGHSMLTETVDRYDPNFNVVGDPNSANPDQQLGLIAAFLNPLAFVDSGPTPAQATGAIVRGVTRTVGNEIDEFVTDALRNNLLGTPLDLAVLNLARGRDTGIPGLNEARREFYADVSDTDLKPYTSWADFVQHIKHPDSLVNFIAAYGTHSTITSATTMDAKRAAAVALVLGGAGAPADRLDFLNSQGAWANDVHGVTTTGVDNIDFWIGGLAEEITPFGGLLGSTFNFVFENQMEKLQDADRFYYLERTSGMNFNAELENNTFAKLVMANTDATHLNALIFHTPALTLEVDPTKQFNADVVLPGPDGLLGTADDVSAPRADPVNVGPFAHLIPLVSRDNPDTVGPDTNYLHYTGDGDIQTAAAAVVIGGTPGDDIIISAAGDDTLYGDAGNDRLDGGFGNDQINGGVGDDIITDSGGNDVIHGDDGNDVIQGGNGANLILGNYGQDFIITGEDASEAFGGPGNDFIYGSKANEFAFGNEGDDWIERGTTDGAAGDNFDPFGNEPVKGNDVFLGDGAPDNVDGEGGDDIYIATPSEADRFIGFGGFDWATYKNDLVGVTVSLDSNERFFDQPLVPGSTSSILTRLDLVEGLSGSHHNDFLLGDNADATLIAGAGADANGSILLNPGLIGGLQDFLNAFKGTAATPVVTRFGDGNIIFGGEGSDIIFGRGGDDLIDGDAWLNVRISVRAGFDANGPFGPEITSADSMAQLIPFMLDGTYDPGQLQIVREILYSPTQGFDTAMFQGALANYSFTVNGVAATAAELAAATANDIITVTDNVVAGVRGDGTDTLRHIERLMFADQSIVLDGVNNEPRGVLTISDTTPSANQLLHVSITGVTDDDNISPTNLTGAIRGPVSYFWQAELRPGSGIFTDLTHFAAGEISRIDSPDFMLTEPFNGIGVPSLTGLELRVRAVYQDGAGHFEQVFSNPTAAVVDGTPGGTLTISDSTPTETQPLTVINALTDADGLVGVTFNYQWRQSQLGGGGAFTNILGATGPGFTPGQAQVNRQLQVVVNYTDNAGNANTFTSPGTIVTGDFIAANAASQLLTGTAGQDIINGGAGADNLIAGDGDDALNGGTGNDVVNAGPGNDTITYAVGDGADAINGDSEVDILNITGTAAASTLNVVFNGTALGGVGGGTLVNVEQIVADLQGGVDSLNYTGSTAGVTVDLGAGSASGFTSIANIENAVGGSGNDLLISAAGVANTLVGGAGNDTYLVHDASDVVGELAGGGVDEVRTTLASYTLASANLENLTYVGAGNFSGTGNAGANVITGISGTDTLLGLAGDDTLNGADGNDSLVGAAGADTLNGGVGDDTLNGGLNNDIVNGGAGDDLIQYTLGDGVDTLDGGAGLDTLTVSGTAAAETLSAVFNGSTLTTVAGLTPTNVERVVANLLGGVDALSYTGSTAGVTVDLGAGSASGFTSIAGIENVVGSSGSDTLISAVGVANVLTGGAGNDVYVVHDAGDTVGELAEGGTDEVRTTLANYTLGNNLENLTFVGTGNFTGTGNAVANVITGGAGSDTLDGGLGNDVVNGGAGNDTLVYSLGAGADVFDGGTGQDTLRVLGSAAANTLAVVFTGVAFTSLPGITTTSVEAMSVDLQGGVDSLSYAGSTTGVTVDLGAGSASGFSSIAGIENVVGGSGNDTLISAAGVANVLTGGAGNDVYVVHDVGDTVGELAAGGTDEVRTTLASFTLANVNLENLSFIGTGAFAGTGNNVANVITGGSGIDTLLGLGGNDTINAGVGNDIVDAGTGNDIINYAVGDGADALDGGIGVDTLNITDTAAASSLNVVFNGTALAGIAGGTLINVEQVVADLQGGIDSLNYTGSTVGVTVDLGAGSASGFTSIANIENAVGGSGNDFLVSAVGVVNSLSGGAGNDTYLVHDAGDVVGELAAGGVDEVRTTLASYVLANANLENLTFVGAGGFSGTGNNGANVITGGTGADTLLGLIGDDTLSGADGNDTLVGAVGNDTLNGGAGNDSLDGGAGNDTLNAGEGNDTLSGGINNDIINAGGGDDLIQYTFGDGVDTIDGGTGLDTVNVTGTAAADTLTALFDGSALTAVAGSTLANVERVVADLQAGVDSLSYAGSTAGATVDLGAGSASGFTSIAGIENVVGGSGNDTLISAAGVANVLNGGAGNDVYVVHDVGDTVGELAAGGTDEVRTTLASFTLANVNLENLSFIGTGAFAGTGNNVANVITGGNGADTLSALAGNDTLIGGAGNDRMTGGTGNDVFMFQAGFGQDTITDFDADLVGGQDLLNLSGLGITAANFGAHVTFAVSDLDGIGILDTTVTVNGTEHIALLGVNGVGANVITQADFILS